MAGAGAGAPGTRHHRAAGAAVAVIALAVGAVACSDDGPTLEEWSAGAGEICAEVQREADALALPTAGPAFAESLRTSAELSREEVEALSGLPTPSERSDEVAAWLDALGRRVTALEAYAGAVAQQPPAEALPPIPEDLAGATGEAAELSLELGLEACGAGVDTPIGSGSPGPTATVPVVPGELPGDVTTTVTNDIGIPPDETVTQDLPG